MTDTATKQVVHHIEESVTVWLKLNDEGTAWVIDSPTFDGYSLEGREDGPTNSECECDDEEACEALLARASEIELPTADELIVTLTEGWSNR